MILKFQTSRVRDSWLVYDNVQALRFNRIDYGDIPPETIIGPDFESLWFPRDDGPDPSDLYKPFWTSFTIGEKTYEIFTGNRVFVMNDAGDTVDRIS